MLEKIILSNTLNETEFFRSLSLNGNNNFAFRIMTTQELAKFSLMKSGVFFEERLLNSTEIVFLLFSFIKKISYFSNASIDDAKNIWHCFCVLSEFSQYKNLEETFSVLIKKSTFNSKNEALYEVYKQYIKIKKEKKLFDKYDVINLAIDKCDVLDGEIAFFDDFELSELDKRLLNKVSNNSKKLKIANFVASDRLNTKNWFDVNYIKAYGSVNEVEYILADILRKNIPFDKCIVACPNVDMYSQIFLNYMQIKNIDLSFKNGISSTNAFPVKLLSLLKNWDELDYNGIDSLKSLIFSDYFDAQKLYQVIYDDEKFEEKTMQDLCEFSGSLKLSFNHEENLKKLTSFTNLLQKKDFYITDDKFDKNLLEIACKFESELRKGLSYFISEYAVIRNNSSIDAEALQKIETFIKYYQDYKINFNISDLLNLVIGQNVNKSLHLPSSLHICSLDDAFSLCCENIYICGMQANDFPGKLKENNLLLDNELSLISNFENVPNSLNILQNKITYFNNLIKILEKCNTKINILYSYYDTVNLKEQNASSVLFNLYKSKNEKARVEDFEEKIEAVGYFKYPTYSTNEIAKKFSNKYNIECNAFEEEQKIVGNLLERFWSPSAIEQFFACPKRFYLTKVLKIPEAETDNPLSVINSAHLGNLAHSMMQFLGENRIEKNNFSKICDEKFNDYLIFRPPLDAEQSNIEKQNFLNMMSLAYDENPVRDIVSSETQYCFKHETGIKIKGIPDRIEILPNKKCIVVDFKTKQNIDHIKNDIDTCLQVVIYAWLCEKAHIKIDHCEYRYLRKKYTVTCKFDDDIKTQLNEKLAIFKSALLNYNFPSDKEEKNINCRYCKLQHLCSWPLPVCESSFENGGDNAR